METKIKKSKKMKEQKERKLNRNKILYKNLLDLRELLKDKEDYRIG